MTSGSGGGYTREQTNNDSDNSDSETYTYIHIPELHQKSSLLKTAYGSLYSNWKHICAKKYFEDAFSKYLNLVTNELVNLLLLLQISVGSRPSVCVANGARSSSPRRFSTTISQALSQSSRWPLWLSSWSQTSQSPGSSPHPGDRGMFLESDTKQFGGGGRE